MSALRFLHYHSCSGLSQVMICIETQYLSLNRVLLLAIGVWPYQQSKFTRFQFIFFSIILMTSFISQLATFMTTKITSDFITTVVSSTTFSLILMINYYAFGIKIEAVKKLFIRLQHICNKLKDKNEIAIIEKYGYLAKCYTVALIVIGICAMIGVIIVQSWNISDSVLSTNVSRSRHMQYVIYNAEYFVDQEKYFFLILLHINTATFIGAIATIGTGSLFIAYYKFLCGMFKISSYRIERAIQINILQNITSTNKILKFETIRGLIYAINTHRQTVKLSTRLITHFEIMFVCLTQLLVVSLCFHLVRIFLIVSSEKAKEALMPIIFVTAEILYLFLSNSIGQTMTDHNSYVFATVYRVEWYLTPLHIQKMILFLLLKGAKSYALNMYGGLFVPSFETFATLVKASVSYFTVVLSTQ